jgi:GNAT superfamily N-acetyltransferase
MQTDWKLRVATEDDIGAMEKLIPLSVRGLQASYYSAAQMEAALGSAFGVDRQLILDKTYFVVEHPPSLGSGAAGECEIIGCGGWSKRKTLFGSDHQTNRDDAELNPASDPARIRAFYVHPAWARRGIGRRILAECEQRIRAAGFTSVELAATLSGVAFYAACGYVSGERLDVPLPEGLSLEIVRMTKELP